MKQNGVNGAVVKQPMIAEAVIDNVSEITACVVITARLRATNHCVVFHQFISKSAMWFAKVHIMISLTFLYAEQLSFIMNKVMQRLSLWSYI